MHQTKTCPGGLKRPLILIWHKTKTTKKGSGVKTTLLPFVFENMKN